MHSRARLAEDSGLAVLPDHAAQIAVGDDADEPAAASTTQVMPSFLRVISSIASAIGVSGPTAGMSAPLCMRRLDAEELLPDRALGMDEGEIVLAEALSSSSRRRPGRRPRASAAVELAVGTSPLGSGFALDPGVEDDVAVAWRSANVRWPVMQMSLTPIRLMKSEEVDDLARLAAVGDGEDDVVLEDHAQVAVARLRPDGRTWPACRSSPAWPRSCGRRGPTCPCR